MGLVDFDQLTKIPETSEISNIVGNILNTIAANAKFIPLKKQAIQVELCSILIMVPSSSVYGPR